MWHNLICRFWLSSVDILGIIEHISPEKLHHFLGWRQKILFLSPTCLYRKYSGSEINSMFSCFLRGLGRRRKYCRGKVKWKLLKLCCVLLTALGPFSWACLFDFLFYLFLLLYLAIILYKLQYIIILKLALPTEKLMFKL